MTYYLDFETEGQYTLLNGTEHMTTVEVTYIVTAKRGLGFNKIVNMMDELMGEGYCAAVAYRDDPSEEPDLRESARNACDLNISPGRISWPNKPVVEVTATKPTPMRKPVDPRQLELF